MKELRVLRLRMEEGHPDMDESWERIEKANMESRQASVMELTSPRYTKSACYLMLQTTTDTGGIFRSNLSNLKWSCYMEHRTSGVSIKWIR
jgi:hypothetical protein